MEAPLPVQPKRVFVLGEPRYVGFVRDLIHTDKRLSLIDDRGAADIAVCVLDCNSSQPFVSPCKPFRDDIQFFYGKDTPVIFVAGQERDHTEMRAGQPFPLTGYVNNVGRRLGRESLVKLLSYEIEIDLILSLSYDPKKKWADQLRIIEPEPLNPPATEKKSILDTKIEIMEKNVQDRLSKRGQGSESEEKLRAIEFKKVFKKYAVVCFFSAIQRKQDSFFEALNLVISLVETQESKPNAVAALGKGNGTSSESLLSPRPRDALPLVSGRPTSGSGVLASSTFLGSSSVETQKSKPVVGEDTSIFRRLFRPK